MPTSVPPSPEPPTQILEEPDEETEQVEEANVVVEVPSGNSPPKIERSESDGELIDVQGSDTAEGLETTTTGYASAAPQYVTEFAAMEYPLQAQHLHNGNPPNYIYADANYSTYYQYTGNVHSPEQYNFHGNSSPTSTEGDQGSLQHATRASPQTIKWLLDNYEPQDGTSLPRCTLYDHYKKHCREFDLDPVNAASFGKLIRNVFQNLKTRRLGTRGNSKYHYYGIRIKPDSALNRFEPHSSEGLRTAAKRPVSSNSHSRNSSSSPMSFTPAPALNSITESDLASLGNGELPRMNFELGNGINEDLARLGLGLRQVAVFDELYKVNCSEVLGAIRHLQFEHVQEIWMQFWQPFDEDEESRRGLTEQQLHSLCTLPQIQQYVYNFDVAFFQVLVDVLVPDVLMSPMTQSLTQACRSFAKNVSMYLKRAMNGAPEPMLKKKLQAVKLLENGLKRYTQLNHVSQAAKAVLLKHESVQAMFNDYIKVDIEQVQEQAGWICGCDFMTVMHIHDAFKDNLHKMASMTTWSEWMESIVDQKLQVLSNFHGTPINEVLELSKQFLLKWSFYTSMIIRDLTLRSAGSFGSFHLIRMLTDDYMIYLVESRLSKVLSRPVIAVMSPVKEEDFAVFEEKQSPIAVQTTLPSISLDPISLPYTSHGQLLYRVEDHWKPIQSNPLTYMVSGEGTIPPQVVLAHNGDILDIQTSTADLL